MLKKARSMRKNIFLKAISLTLGYRLTYSFLIAHTAPVLMAFASGHGTVDVICDDHLLTGTAVFLIYKIDFPRRKTPKAGRHTTRRCLNLLKNILANGSAIDIHIWSLIRPFCACCSGQMINLSLLTALESGALASGSIFFG